VGYSTDAGPTGLHIAGYQFIDGSETVESVLGDQLPVGTKVYLYTTGSGYSISTYESYFDLDTFTTVTNWNPKTADLSGATGFWVENNSGAAVQSIMSGEVPMDDSFTNSIVEGLQLLTYPYPVAMDVVDMGFSPNIGDKIYTYSSGYSIATYETYFDIDTFTTVTDWNPKTASVEVGEGFWYEGVAASTWVATRPF
jgi:hypothetical protein